MEGFLGFLAALIGGIFVFVMAACIIDLTIAGGGQNEA